MRKCEIYFSSKPLGDLDQSGTNFLMRQQFREDEFKIEWTLLENSSAEKFYNNIIALKEPERRSFIRWNLYDSGLNLQEIIDELNSELDYCNSNDYVTFTPDYYVGVDLDKEELHKRLNAIHYAFEQKLYHHQKNGTATQDFLTSLERLNKLVHTCENTWLFSTDGKKLYVVRNNGEIEFPDCDDNDYKNFQSNFLDGHLYSDFFTVGKDLGTAFFTDDKLLITNREVKQQSKISGACCFEISTKGYLKENPKVHEDRLYRQYYKWCEDNNVQEYGYNFTEHKYRLGRVRIGLIEPYPVEYYLKQLNKFPYVSGIHVYEC